MTDNKNNTHNLSFLYRILCWCSGARLYILKDCPTDYNKFFGIGSVVVFTGLMAAISGTYALYTIFEVWVFAIIFGIFWGCLIFFLDWYILASLKKERSIYKEFLNTLPRILLAVLIGIVIAKPLELRLFQKEINRELFALQQDMDLNYKDKLFLEFDEISAIQKQNEALKNEIQQKEQYRKELFELMVAEAEGRSPTGKEGKGPVYKEKKAEYDRISQELNTLQDLNLNQIKQNNQKIEELTALRQNEIIQINKSTLQYDGFLARMEALGSLSNRNKYINVTSFFIMLLFIVIEASPMLVKLMAKRGPYDDLFELEELKKSTIVKKDIHQINNDLASNTLNSDNKKDQIDEINKQLTQEFLEDYQKRMRNINMEKLKKWEEDELKNISKSASFNPVSDYFSD